MVYTTIVEFTSLLPKKNICGVWYFSLDLQKPLSQLARNIGALVRLRPNCICKKDEMVYSGNCARTPQRLFYSLIKAICKVLGLRNVYRLCLILTWFLSVQEMPCWDTNANSNIWHLYYVITLFAVVTVRLNNMDLGNPGLMHHAADRREQGLAWGASKVEAEWWRSGHMPVVGKS